MLLRKLVNMIDTRSWSDDYLTQAVGSYESAYFSYAGDPALRANAASGGSVSAVLVHLLDTDRVDGPLGVSSWGADHKVHCGFRIATTGADVVSAQGSKYMPVHFRREALPLIRAFGGRLAVVLLPCDAKALAREFQSDPALKDQVQFVITLTCGHNSERELTDAIVDRLLPKGSELSAFQHRFGHWRGNLRLTTVDGQQVVKPFQEFSVYQNLFFFSQKKCHACFDHFGFHGDLGAGDIWSQKMRNDPVKKNALIARSPLAKEVLDEMFKLGRLEGEGVAITDVCNGQSRSLPFHFNVSARARVGRIFGMRLKDTTHQSPSWNEILAAFLVMTNERITRSETGRRLVLLTPKPFLKAYLILIKGLESL